MEVGQILFKGINIWRAYKNNEVVWHRKIPFYFDVGTLPIYSIGTESKIIQDPAALLYKQQKLLIIGKENLFSWPSKVVTNEIENKPAIDVVSENYLYIRNSKIRKPGNVILKIIKNFSLQVDPSKQVFRHLALKISKNFPMYVKNSAAGYKHIQLIIPKIPMHTPASAVGHRQISIDIIRNFYLYPQFSAAIYRDLVLEFLKNQSLKIRKSRRIYRNNAIIFESLALFVWSSSQINKQLLLKLWSDFSILLKNSKVIYKKTIIEFWKDFIILLQNASEIHRNIIINNSNKISIAYKHSRTAAKVLKILFGRDLDIQIDLSKQIIRVLSLIFNKIQKLNLDNSAAVFRKYAIVEPHYSILNSELNSNLSRELIIAFLRYSNLYVLQGREYRRNLSIRIPCVFNVTLTDAISFNKKTSIIQTSVEKIHDLFSVVVNKYQKILTNLEIEFLLKGSSNSQTNLLIKSFTDQILSDLIGIMILNYCKIISQFLNTFSLLKSKSQKVLNQINSNGKQNLYELERIETKEEVYIKAADSIILDLAQITYIKEYKKIICEVSGVLGYLNNIDIKSYSSIATINPLFFKTLSGLTVENNLSIKNENSFFLQKLISKGFSSDGLITTYFGNILNELNIKAPLSLQKILELFEDKLNLLSIISTHSIGRIYSNYNFSIKNYDIINIENKKNISTNTRLSLESLKQKIAQFKNCITNLNKIVFTIPDKNLVFPDGHLSSVGMDLLLFLKDEKIVKADKKIHSNSVKPILKYLNRLLINAKKYIFSNNPLSLFALDNIEIKGNGIISTSSYLSFLLISIKKEFDCYCSLASKSVAYLLASNKQNPILNFAISQAKNTMMSVIDKHLLKTQEAITNFDQIDFRIVNNQQSFLSLGVQDGIDSILNFVNHISKKILYSIKNQKANLQLTNQLIFTGSGGVVFIPTAIPQLLKVLLLSNCLKIQESQQAQFKALSSNERKIKFVIQDNLQAALSMFDSFLLRARGKITSNKTKYLELIKNLVVCNYVKITSNKTVRLSFDEGLVFLYGNKQIKIFVSNIKIRRTKRNYSTVHTNFVNYCLPTTIESTPKKVDQAVASTTCAILSMENGEDYKWTYPVQVEERLCFSKTTQVNKIVVERGSAVIK